MGNASVNYPDEVHKNVQHVPVLPGTMYNNSRGDYKMSQYSTAYAGGRAMNNTGSTVHKCKQYSSLI